MDWKDKRIELLEQQLIVAQAETVVYKTVCDLAGQALDVMTERLAAALIIKPEIDAAQVRKLRDIHWKIETLKIELGY